MRILVTGGAGYIGSHACKALARAGHQPIVYDNLSCGHRWAVKWGPFVEGDLADTPLLRSTFQQYGIEAVMHFAASTYVGESVTEPRKYYRNNLVNALGLLDAMVDAGVKPIVFSSTCATYGAAQTDRMDESHPQNPVNPYGETKLALERAMHWYGGAYGIVSAKLRYFNAAGADPDGETGELHDPETHVIPRLLDAAGDPAFTFGVFGTDYPTRDGTALRDYVHVSDLADAHVLAVEHLARTQTSFAVNLGTGTGSTVRELLDVARRVTGREIRAQDKPRREGDPPCLVAGGDLARTLLGWNPKRSDLETLVRDAWAWREQHLPRILAAASR